MEEKPSSLWKLRLAALGLGILGVPFVYLIALKISNDLRLISASGIVFLFCAAAWLGRKKQDWLSGILLVAPVTAIFVYEVMNKIPALWPNLVLWAAAVAIGLVFVGILRTRMNAALALVAALLIPTAWFCGWYTPKQLAAAFSKVKDVSAPSFELQPVSNGSVPTSSKAGKVLVVDFFSTTCAPCMAELPEIVAARQDLAGNNDVDFVLVASDLGRDTPDGFRAFAQRRGLTLPLAFDVGGKAHDGFGLKGVPALVVLDRMGRVRFTHEGYNPAEKNFRPDLVQLLKTL
jgi:thiol-disulfide isomerase/thioredoxin